ncbi:sigma-70 RNA polymerase sigma factor region 4 domain-containing protein [Streptomyces achromogenes]|uniref:hypothetical protein n=1 Tax=Streptomyces achromogenes TaxID=67255 RepID=UPI0036C2220F
MLGEAAFGTLALRQETSAEGQAAQLAESLELYAAISRLPDTQLDVMVLRHMCGYPAEDVFDLLASRWPPYGPPSATPDASWTTPSSRPRPKDPPRDHTP